MRTIRFFSLTSICLLVLGAAGIGYAAPPKTISRTGDAGPYSITLKVLPAESFEGPSAEMAWDAGANPVLLGAPSAPDHHVVAFIERDGVPVKDADVAIAVERKGSASGWQPLPVARMHVAGKGASTTHFGNNVKLEPGDYEARVTVNGKSSATFEFTTRAS
jgi:hypothetical protein